MDIERTMQFIVEQRAATAAKLDALADRQAEAEKRQDRDIARINGILRRAIRLSGEEQRRERVRRQQMAAEFDDKITKLAAAQLLGEGQMRELREAQKATEASLKAFLDSMRRGGNGRQ
jgi:hypothetical protein